METQQNERRRHPRIPYEGKTELRVTAMRDYPVLDISPGGIFFQSDQSHELGTLLSIGDRNVSFDARVKGCDVVESDRNMMEYRYLVRCSFEPEIDSDQFEFVLEMIMDGKQPS